jgi:hypothetical protein
MEEAMNREQRGWRYTLVVSLAACALVALVTACGAPTTPAEGHDPKLAASASAAQSELASATAEANYKMAIEQASDDAEAALKQCDEGLTGELQTGCRDHATAAYASAQARAEADRTATARTN